MTPYTTSAGLQIGRCYIPPPMVMQGDAVVIQAALLAKPHYDPDRIPMIVGLIGIVVAICFGVLS